jgi:hypothetical protein
MASSLFARSFPANSALQKPKGVDGLFGCNFSSGHGRLVRETYGEPVNFLWRLRHNTAFFFRAPDAAQ